MTTFTVGNDAAFTDTGTTPVGATSASPGNSRLSLSTAFAMTNADTSGKPIVIDLTGGVELFASLDVDCLAKLRRISLRRSFTDGQVIHLQDDEARFLNVVLTGHVRLCYMTKDGSAVLYDVVPPCAVFGEFSVLDRSTYPDIASAIGRVALVSFPSTALFDLAQVQPSLARALSGAVALRVRTYIGLVRDLSLPSLSARLAHVLVRLVDRLNAFTDYKGRAVPVVSAVVTQTDLGLMARGSRGNVNRILQAWQRAGWIALQERSIVVLNRSALLIVAADERD